MKRRYVALDSNLLLLYVVGTYSQIAIKNVKRLRPYQSGDFRLLIRLLERSAGIVVTPNTVTETSNLLRQGGENGNRAGISETLKTLTASVEERYVRTSEALARPEAAILGVTDAVLLTLAESGANLLTADSALYAAAIKAGHPAQNFNYERQTYRT